MIVIQTLRTNVDEGLNRSLISVLLLPLPSPFSLLFFYSFLFYSFLYFPTLPNPGTSSTIHASQSLALLPLPTFSDSVLHASSHLPVYAPPPFCNDPQRGFFESVSWPSQSSRRHPRTRPRRRRDERRRSNARRLHAATADAGKEADSIRGNCCEIDTSVSLKTLNIIQLFQMVQ